MRGRCGTGHCGGINGKCEESRREALVAMVHTADLGNGDDLSDLGQLYRPPAQDNPCPYPDASFIPRLSPSLAQVALVEDDEVIQTLAAYRTDDPLDVRILPRVSAAQL